MLHSLTIPAYTNMLTNLASELDKAAGCVEEIGITRDELLGRSLAPDMLPLSTQIRFCCMQVRGLVARLTGGTPEDVREITSFEDAKALLAEALDFLAAVPADAFDGAEARMVEFDLPNGMKFAMTGFEYVRDWAQPQLYFHKMTAYAIMRHAGVPLGKADYIAHMAKYSRTSG